MKRLTNILRHNIKVLFLVLCSLLYSCSSEEEEYIPFVASTLGNSVWLSLERQDGTKYDYDSLLQNGKLSIYGVLSKKNLSLRVITTNTDFSYIEFPADLPNSSSMQLNEKKTEGYGSSDAIINIDGKRSKMTFHFRFNSLGIPEMYGGNGISIDSITYNNKGIKILRYWNVRKITLREDSNGEFELQ